MPDTFSTLLSSSIPPAFDDQSQPPLTVQRSAAAASSTSLPETPQPPRVHVQGSKHWLAMNPVAPEFVVTNQLKTQAEMLATALPRGSWNDDLKREFQYYKNAMQSIAKEILEKSGEDLLGSRPDAAQPVVVEIKNEKETDELAKLHADFRAARERLDALSDQLDAAYDEIDWYRQGKINGHNATEAAKQRNVDKISSLEQEVERWKNAAGKKQEVIDSNGSHDRQALIRQKEQNDALQLKIRQLEAAAEIASPLLTDHRRAINAAEALKDAAIASEKTAKNERAAAESREKESGKRENAATAQASAAHDKFVKEEDKRRQVESRLLDTARKLKQAERDIAGLQAVQGVSRADEWLDLNQQLDVMREALSSAETDMAYYKAQSFIYESDRTQLKEQLDRLLAVIELGKTKLPDGRLTPEMARQLLDALELAMSRFHLYSEKFDDGRLMIEIAGREYTITETASSRRATRLWNEVSNQGASSAVKTSKSGNKRFEIEPARSVAPKSQAGG